MGVLERGAGRFPVILENQDVLEAAVFFEVKNAVAESPEHILDPLGWKIRQEAETGTRVGAENADFITLAPYAPRFPFETWILPKQHESAFENSSSHMFENLAKALKNLLTKAERVLDNPPYNLVIHSSPVQDPNNDHYHWHIEFMPKLTKTAGFEWGTGFYINPTPPEEAAKFLREASVEETSTTAAG